MNTRRIGWFVIGVVVMSLVVIGVYTVIKTTEVTQSTNDIAALIRSDQKAGQQRSKETAQNTERVKQLAETIKSCTTPAGECYKRNVEQTGKAVASINDVITAAVTCAKRPEVVTTAQTRACVRIELAALTP